MCNELLVVANGVQEGPMPATRVWLPAGKVGTSPIHARDWEPDMLRKGQVNNYLLLVIILILAFLIFHVFGLSRRVLVVCLASAVFLAAFVKTDLALILLLFSMLLSPEFGTGGAIPGRAVVLRFDDVILFVVFFGWLARMGVHKELGLLRATSLNKPILAYVFVCILATGIGGVRGTTNAKHGFFYILKYVEYFILFFMVSNSIRDKKQVKVFVTFMLLTCLVVGVYALRSYFVEGVRATAPFEGKAGEANTLAGYLIIMMGMTMGLFFYARSVRLRFLLGGLFVFMTLPFLYTLSRGGWFGFFAMWLTFLILCKRNREMLLLVSLGIIIAAPLILPKAVIHRYRATFMPGTTYNVLGKKITIDESAALRVKSWEGSLKQWRERPILGHGVPAGGVVSDVQYTRVLREVGVIGFLAFSWIIATLFRIGWRSFVDSQVDDFGRGLSLGFISALAGLLVMGVASEVFIIVRIMEPFWFLAAIVVMLPELYALPETAVSGGNGS